MLTAERLRALLIYDPESGAFRRRISTRNGRPAGEVCGCLHHYGYIIIKIDQKIYQAHRLAWLYMTGEWPNDKIDHQDCDRANNRWHNLREATDSQNAANKQTCAPNILGYRGIRRAHGGWYFFVIRANGKRKAEGRFATPEEAHAAYVREYRAAHGAFARI